MKHPETPIRVLTLRLETYKRMEETAKTDADKQRLVTACNQIQHAINILLKAEERG